MAEFTSQEEIGNTPFERSHQIEERELGDEDIARLARVGELVYSIIKAVPQSKRGEILQDSHYALGVSSTSSGEEYSEEPDHLVWVRHGYFEVSREMTRDNGPKTILTVKSGGIATDMGSVQDAVELQELLDLHQGSKEYELMLAKRWLTDTEKFLLEKTKTD